MHNWGHHGHCLLSRTIKAPRGMIWNEVDCLVLTDCRYDDKSQERVRLLVRIDIKTISTTMVQTASIMNGNRIRLTTKWEVTIVDEDKTTTENRISNPLLVVIIFEPLCWSLPISFPPFKFFQESFYSFTFCGVSWCTIDIKVKGYYSSPSSYLGHRSYSPASRGVRTTASRNTEPTLPVSGYIIVIE